MSDNPAERSGAARWTAAGLAALLFILCFGQTPVLRLLVGLLVGAAGFVHLRARGWNLVDRPIAVLLTLWVGWCLITTAWAPNVTQSLRAAVEEALLPAGCFLAAVSLARGGGRLSWVFAGQSAGLLVLFLMTVAISLQSGWLALLSHDGRPEIFSTYPGTGVVTSHYVMALPFLLLLARQGRAGLASSLAFVAMAVTVGVFAQNRMYWLTLMALSAGAVLLYAEGLRRRAEKWFWPAVLVLAAGLVALLMLSVSVRVPGEAGTLAKIEQAVRSDTRWRGWQFWIDKGLQQPVAGVGFGKKALRAALSDREKAEIDTFDSLLKGHPHNYFLTIWITTGFVGLALNASLFIAFARLLWSRRQRAAQASVRDAGAVGLLLIVALLTKNLTDDQFSNSVPYYFWILLGLAYGMETAPAGHRPEIHPRTASESVRAGAPAD